MQRMLVYGLGLQRSCCCCPPRGVLTLASASSPPCALLQAAGAGRVLILDWDVHHGNGTQHIFEADPSVLYMSLHRHDGCVRACVVGAPGAAWMMASQLKSPANKLCPGLPGSAVSVCSELVRAGAAGAAWLGLHTAQSPLCPCPPSPPLCVCSLLLCSGSFYPGTGAAHEVGEGPGEGYSVNVPWPCGGMRNGDYQAAFHHVLLPIAYGELAGAATQGGGDCRGWEGGKGRAGLLLRGCRTRAGA